MFCIAAFIIFAILGIFSANYRSLAKKAWECVFKKVTFKPCDISLQEEIKSRLVGKLIFTKPRLARFINRYAGILSLIFVILSIWSLVVVFQSGLNLFVYGTCSQDNPESCVLGGDGYCGIASEKPAFWPSLKEGKVFTWAKDEVVTFADTVSKIPNRIKNWDAEKYTSESNTYYKPFESQKPVALEIIDPSCQFCAKLFNNIKQAGFDDRYNLTYLVYPIPDSKTDDGYRFPNSILIASYLEAVKKHPLAGATIPADWQILDKIFTQKDASDVSFQTRFNLTYTSAEAEGLLISWLADIGYSEQDREQIRQISLSDEVKSELERQKKVVEDEIQTIKIPTIIFGGRRHDGALEPDKLK